MKKEKRTVPMFSIAAGLTWRMGIVTGALWFTAMSLLTVISSQQLQRQWIEYAIEMTSLHMTDETSLPGEMEAARIAGMWTYDFLGQMYLDLPLYKDPTYFRSSTEQLYTDYETATVFFKDGDPVMSNGNYVTFEYLHGDSWAKGLETPDGHAYIDMSRLSEGNLGIGFSNTADVFRLTGCFEDHQFVLQELAGFTVDYPTLYEGKTLSQWDQEKGLNWKIYYEAPQAQDRELVCVYTTELSTYRHMANRLMAKLLMEQPDELKNLLLSEQPERSESRSLIKTVIVTKRAAVTPDGTQHAVLTALRCYPVQAAIQRLYPIYIISELLCALAVILYYVFLKRRLRDPLQQIIRRGQQNMLPLNFPYRPGWKEPYLLEELYISAQQELQQLRQDNKQLKTALDYAENAERNRRQMVSAITHELKTPLAVIHSYCEGLQTGIAPEKQEHYLNVITQEADRMDAMVLEMLDLSRLEAGKVRLSQDRVELLELTRGILTRLQPLIEAKELQITHAITEPCTLIADEGRLIQVITNLTTNAIKYSPQGGQIWINIFQKNGFTHFTIENESEPLSEEALQKVWESFYRTEQSRTSPGTGLGLSICKAIIELHRGSCHVKNTSTGVEFGFFLPG